MHLKGLTQAKIFGETTYMFFSANLGTAQYNKFKKQKNENTRPKYCYFIIE